jgi:hypothetical protein
MAGFEDVMMRRLANCHAEACTEILASVKAGRSLSDAVTDAIEVLPASKSRALRRWIQDWEAWEAWLVFKKKGWRVERARGGYAIVTAPRGVGGASGDGLVDKGVQPPPAAIAAGLGVRGVARASSWKRDQDWLWCAHFQIVPT